MQQCCAPLPSRETSELRPRLGQHGATRGHSDLTGSVSMQDTYRRGAAYVKTCRGIENTTQNLRTRAWCGETKKIYSCAAPCPYSTPTAAEASRQVGAVPHLTSSALLPAKARRLGVLCTQSQRSPSRGAAAKSLYFARHPASPDIRKHTSPAPLRRSSIGTQPAARSAKAES